MDNCQHLNFKASVTIARLTDSEDGPVRSYRADVRVECAECHRPFQFLGLPLGLLSDGAAMSLDGLKARLVIAPVGSVEQPLDAALLAGCRVGSRLDS